MVARALVFLVTTLVAVGLTVACCRGMTLLMDRLGPWTGVFFIFPVMAITGGVIAGVASRAVGSNAYGLTLMGVLLIVWLTWLVTWSRAETPE